MSPGILPLVRRPALARRADDLDGGADVRQVARSRDRHVDPIEGHGSRSGLACSPSDVGHLLLRPDDRSGSAGLRVDRYPRSPHRLDERRPDVRGGAAVPRLGGRVRAAASSRRTWPVRRTRSTPEARTGHRLPPLRRSGAVAASLPAGSSGSFPCIGRSADGQVFPDRALGPPEVGPSRRREALVDRLTRDGEVRGYLLLRLTSP